MFCRPTRLLPIRGRPKIAALMSLQPGTRLAHYEILEPIGKGGMGEVYRARDGKLGRDVAIKVLPEAFAEDTERLKRFQREAKVLASLNHPNIAAIYGLEQSGSTHYLVLELVEGETLAERIARGPIPEDEALAIASKIADALEEAHEHGIVHRDLKPANIKLTPDGKVKVLDFGLAKVFVEETPDVDSSMSPTITRDGTRVGVILGTAAYMSPEQAKGKDVDKRTDIFAYGAVLFEMLTGKKTFPGEDVSEVLAAVIQLEPDWTMLPRGLDPRIAHLLRRCLEKDPRTRRRDIGDVRNEMTEAPMTPRSAGSAGRRWTLVAFLAGAVVAGSVAALIPRRTLVTSPGVFRVSLLTPEDPVTGIARHVLAISPDGTRVVFTTAGGLFLRELDAMEALPIRGTERTAGNFSSLASEPVFSPDGEWILFHASGELKKVPVHGGIPTTLCAAATLFGASWPVDDFILFASQQGVLRVSANGGVPEVVVAVDSEKGEIAQGPRLLPDGDTLLFALGNAGNWDEANIVAQDLTSGARQVLIRGGADAVYASTGHLLYVNGNTLYAAAFDLRRLEVKGGAVPVIEGVSRTNVFGTAQYSLSSTGVLVYVANLSEETTLAWVDRGGAVEAIVSPKRGYSFPRLSPDGKRLVVGFEGDLWIHDLLRSSWTRLTFTGTAARPAWIPDGTRIVFSSTQEGSSNLYWVAADGSGEAEAMLEPGIARHSDSISRDGRWASFHEHDPVTGTDLWWLRLDGEAEAQPYLETAFNERVGALSPDGQWLAYVSDETGRDEIYVRSFPDPTSKHSISADGGGAPTWSHDGRELFFVTRDRDLMVVEVTRVPEFRASTPTPLFNEATAGVDLSAGGNYVPNYDVTPDGGRFLTLQVQGDAVPQLHLIVNWFEELEQRVPTDK
ncbi:MAG: serine/threonine-protein kinase [Acidobacteria bacterium]|nr:MAG: serine/threonine-protein kinase [Acidobacteriota bacterium]